MSSLFKADLYNGKVVFCTGGGTGINREIVRQLMQLGANAIIVGRRLNVIEGTAAELSKETGQICVGVSADVRDPAALKAAVKIGVEKLGRIDFVIAGAAGNFLATIDGMSENAFATVMAIDTLGTYNTIKATIEHVKKTKGSYIAISATLHYSGTALQGQVSAAKAAIDALFRVACVEYGPWGVRFNVIAPGPISGTEGMDRLVGNDPDIVETVTRRIPLQRYGQKSEIADASVFLFSPAASYITGAVLVVDGGDYHMKSQGALMPYPEIVMQGGDTRALIASKL